MGVTFGKRVVGEKAHAEAVAAQEGGSDVFGKRVRGAIGSDSIANQEKRQSEFGHRTTAGASITDPTGKTGTISVEDLKALLDDVTGNVPAFIDSLYEHELGLPGGPRKDALEVIAVAEMGIKGAGRRSVLDEINALLGKGDATAEEQAQKVADEQEKFAAQQERSEENLLLADAPRLKALKEREENLKIVKGSSQAEADPAFASTGIFTPAGNVKGDGKSGKPAAKKK